MQVPAPTNVTVFVATVQTLVVVDEIDTVSPDVAVAMAGIGGVAGYVAPPTVGDAGPDGELKFIV